jgi:hypothetical protein
LYGFKQPGAEPLMYNKSVVKTSYDRKCIAMILQKYGMMDCKSMANSHDYGFEEDERL